MEEKKTSIDSALRLFLKDLILEILQEMNQKVEKPVESRNLTIKEAAEYLHLSKACLYNKTSKNLIPFMKTGKNLIFSKDELDCWLRGKAKPTIEDLNTKANEIIRKNRTRATQRMLKERSKKYDWK